MSSGYRRFTVLIGAHVFSELGASIMLIALPWFVLQETGSAALTGLSGAGLAAAAIGGGLVGGVLVDRAGFKRTSILADAVSAVALLAVPILYGTIGIRYWEVLLLVFLARVLDVPAITARRSMVPEIAERARMPLERANSLFEGGMHASTLLGPVSAGLFIALVGAANVFVVSAALVTLGALTMLLFMPGDVRATATEQAARASIVSEFVEGLRFLRNDRLLFALLIAIGALNMLTFPFAGVILPVYVDQVLGSAAYLGIILSTFGAGTVAGVLLYGAFGHRLPRRGVYIIGHALIPVPIIALLLQAPFPVLLLTTLILALGFGPINPILVTVRHERIPLALRGRVFSVFSAFAMTCSPLGAMIAGVAIDALGIDLTLGIIIALISAGVLFLIGMPLFRQMERPAKPLVVTADDD
jgi:predicted MFS family arabinose efflux permease